MNAACRLLTVLLLAAPSGAGAQSLSQLSEALGGLPAAAAPEPVPAPDEKAAAGSGMAEVDFLVRPEAEHAAGAVLFSPYSGFAEGASQKAAAGGPDIPYLDIAKAEAKAQGVDLALVLAIIQKESSFDANARSAVGARGLMQLMPATAKWMGLKDTRQLSKPAVNIKYGVKYLKYLWDEFAGMPAGDLSAEDINKRTAQMAIAAYNAGQGNVRKYDGVPPFKETRTYVKKVTEYFSAFEKLLLEVRLP